jgi:hypothetical protein
MIISSEILRGDTIRSNLTNLDDQKLETSYHNVQTTHRVELLSKRSETNRGTKENS